MLRFLTAGESHGQGLVVIVEGLPSGLAIDFDAMNHDLRQRQAGYGRGRRMAIESDRAEVLSGVRRGRTTGAPVALLIRNRDWSNWQATMHVEAEMPDGAPGAKRAPVVRPRPGHADLAGALKYEHEDIRDVLERASARETAARVAAGAIARQLLHAVGVRDRQSRDQHRGCGASAGLARAVRARAGDFRGLAIAMRGPRGGSGDDSGRSTPRVMRATPSAAHSRWWPTASRSASAATCSGTASSMGAWRRR